MEKIMPIIHERLMQDTGEVRADKDYFLDANGEITLDSTKAASWVARKGAFISLANQKKYGIPTTNETEAPKKDKADEPEGSQDGKSKEPAENKKLTPSKNKGANK